MFNNICGKKYRIWFYLIVLFSALPVLINIGWDFIVLDPKKPFWVGLRLIDFLICGFCLIGGALCDRFNSDYQPSTDAVIGGFMAALAALGFYLAVKWNSSPLNAPHGVYARDNVLVTLIILFYLFSFIFSFTLVRKTLVKG
jgi:hypothetical protein